MDKLAKKLAKGYFTLEELGVKLKDVRRLRDKGYRVFQVRRDGKTTYSILSESENVSVFMSGPNAKETEFRWAETSDIHAGSKQFDESGLREFLAKCEGDGYETVFLAGDQVDGTSIYRGHATNLRFLMAEEQADLLSEILVDYKLSYYATHGNHDCSFAHEGAPNPNVLIERNVPGFTYLPYYAADFVIGGIVRRQLHGASGRSYALSYPGQTYMRNLFDSTGEHVYVNGKKYRLRFVQFGHYHTTLCYECAGVVVTHSGSWQFPNDYTVRRGLVGPQGGRFMDSTISDGRVIRYKTSFFKPRRGR